ncbi:MAG TPA: NfeD family protein [Paucimonas sp.]|nr:NfeD family protein [Paucimonas sp.]
MTEWMLWSALAGIAVIFELFTGTFYLLMIAIGFMVGGVAAWLGLSSSTQLIVAGIVGVVAIYALRHSRFGKRLESAAEPARDPNVNLDIGQALTIEQWNGDAARVMYRGAMWDVGLAEGEVAQPGSFVIREVRGNRLIVSRQ